MRKNRKLACGSIGSQCNQRGIGNCISDCIGGKSGGDYGFFSVKRKPDFKHGAGTGCSWNRDADFHPHYDIGAACSKAQNVKKWELNAYALICCKKEMTCG